MAHELHGSVRRQARENGFEVALVEPTSKIEAYEFVAAPQTAERRRRAKEIQRRLLDHTRRVLDAAQHVTADALGRIAHGGHGVRRGKLRDDPRDARHSERRAETVKKFLMENYKISAETLVSAGYGETDLKNKTDPSAAENRRVQIVNMAKHETAGK
jgi:hypothetical protein